MTTSFLRVAAMSVVITNLPLFSRADDSRVSEEYFPKETVLSHSKSQPPKPTQAPILPDLVHRQYDDTFEICGWDPEYDYWSFYCYGNCVTSDSFWGCCERLYSTDACTMSVPTTCVELDRDEWYTRDLTDTIDSLSTHMCWRSTYSYSFNTYTASSIGYCITLLSIDADFSTFSSFSCSDSNMVLTIQSALYTTENYDNYFGDDTTSNGRTNTLGTDIDGTTATSNIQTISAKELEKERSQVLGIMIGSVLGGVILITLVTLGIVTYWIKRYPDDTRSSPILAESSKRKGKSMVLNATAPVTAADVTSPQQVHVADLTARSRAGENAAPEATSSGANVA